MSIRHLDALMAPRSIAVVGASNSAGSIGATVWRNVRAGAFSGTLQAVNPSRKTLDGMTVFSRCRHLPQAPDLAIVCTPARTLVEIIQELGALGTRAAIIVTGGLTSEQKMRLRQAAQPHLLRLLGPDCLGLLSPHNGVNASCAHTDALTGELAFVSQSGALLTAVLDWSKSRRIGFSHLVSLGDHLDIDFGDLLDYLASDIRTRAILLYAQTIEAPRKFMSAARAAARNKPVIIVKSGRLGHGQAGGPMPAHSDAVIDAAIRRAGMLRVESLDELFIAAETLARFHGSTADGLTLMTNSGGAGIIAADAASRADIVLPDISANLMKSLDTILPPTWSRGNPVDIIGDAPAKRYSDTLDALLADPRTGTILFMHAPNALVRSDELAHACIPLVRNATDRVMACWLGDAAVAEARRIFEDVGVADYRTPEEAVRAFDMLARYRNNQALLQEAPTASEAKAPDVATARRLIATALAEGREQLDAVESKALLAAYGICVVPTIGVAPQVEAAVQAATAMGYPVVLTLRSHDLDRNMRSDHGEPILRDEAMLRETAKRMLNQVAALVPPPRISGFSVQPVVRRPQACELMVGASVDPLFGPVLIVGQGGRAVDKMADHAMGLPPMNRTLARDMIARTRISRLLSRYGDQPMSALNGVSDILVAISQMQADLPELAKLEINPLWADEQGVIALEACVRLSATAVAGTDRFAILPYPGELAQTLVWQGHTLLLRPIRPEDETRHREFVERVAPEDLRLRFFSSQRELPRGALARLVQIDYAREMAFIALQTTPGGENHILGVVRAVCDPDNIEAEFAILVRSDLKSQGLGSQLLDKMITYLRTLGTKRIVGYVMRENEPMRTFLRHRGFEPIIPDAEPGTALYGLDLQSSASR